MDAPASMRKDYHKRQLSEDSVTADPFQQFTIWWQEAVSAKIEEPNAMTLATASIDGLPAARTVLLKAFDVNGF
ncbi:MAG TPA: pyridoxamine 5'-phosphate oxidase family protein, partial [Puia sp.]|nr:pyridoxamine 5'-phosphate oxidase family protein [Puia sp.]